ncbi:hypothetical protein B0H15DRAFT_807097 [Mycena belliarum]|uniref:Uncharacterized protein n=1 Tax=Mycena belliarum TaxID=1033014 RepID=A0AAD6TLY6_9AGAR|nr:hypothetical protein B0H15DRAFT_807097 [Mycena belliae]
MSDPLYLSDPMANSQAHKKIKAKRKVQRARADRQYELRSAAAHTQSSVFLACNKIILYHFLEACTLATLITLSHTSHLFRTLVKTLHRLRLIRIVEQFLGTYNVETFFIILEQTGSAIGGSTLPCVLAPPIDDVDDWMPSNLNLFIPRGQSRPWHDFLLSLGLHCRSFQPGIAHPYKAVTSSHVEYDSKLEGCPISITESANLCVLSPATAAATTLGMCVATCSNMYIFYPELMFQRRALKAYYQPTVQSCITMDTRGYLCWGGYGDQMRDNGTVGIPFTDVSIKWRLGIRCSNHHCPWFSDNHPWFTADN